MGVELRSYVTNLGPMKRAPALILEVGPVAREVCAAAGSALITDPDGAIKITLLLHDYFAPDAAGSVDQEVARSLRLARTTQTMGEYPVRSDLLRRKAESKLQMGWAFFGDPCVGFAHAERLPFPA